MKFIMKLCNFLFRTQENYSCSSNIALLSIGTDVELQFERLYLLPIKSESFRNKVQDIPLNVSLSGCLTLAVSTVRQAPRFWAP